jgi:hypothetical protein
MKAMFKRYFFVIVILLVLAIAFIYRAGSERAADAGMTDMGATDSTATAPDAGTTPDTAPKQ